MTINKLTDEQLENIIERAEDAAKRYGPEWDSALVGDVNGNFHAITSDTIQAVVVQANDDSRDASWLCDYLESVSPAFVLPLVRELQQYRKAPKVSFYRDGIEAAAGWVEKQREAYDSEHGRHDPSTGSFEFGNDAQRDYSATLAEIAEGIRALHPGTDAQPLTAAEREELQEYRKAAAVEKLQEAGERHTDAHLADLAFYAGESICHPDPNFWVEFDRLTYPGAVLSLVEEIQERRKMATPLTDPERQELIKLRNEDVLRRQQWAQGMQHDPTFGGILPKL